ncbi:hypothetical protein DICVIV_04873 [Dictyocaulus viviparus]|uniref:Chondroitin proteoglycan 4 domain-containing protein n=1 Tax=Dictyocaulus viviparus TaxID=29172 RepID=A0A0D8XYY4_DICVI|nr:hypothetical protein DICVIV_04873 [Dictyocaulus viviparus]
MNGMQQSLAGVSSEWTVDMVTPLQALLSQSHRAQLFYRMDSVCRLNTVYQSCLSSCPRNPAKRILLNGQKTWNIICDDFRNDTDFRETVLPCWAKMGVTLTNHCAPMASLLQVEMLQLMEGGLENVQQGMDGFCRSVHFYDKCFVGKNYEACGVKAGRFLIKLTQQTSHALMELLDNVLKLENLPDSCKEWLNQKDTDDPRPRAIARRMKNNKLSFTTSISIIFLMIRTYLVV